MAIWKPLGFETIAAPAGATGLTVPRGAVRALIDVEDQGIRWRDDGNDPSTTVGMMLAVADDVFDYRGDLSAFTVIELVGGAEVNISYYGQGN